MRWRIYTAEDTHQLTIYGHLQVTGCYQGISVRATGNPLNLGKFCAFKFHEVMKVCIQLKEILSEVKLQLPKITM
jgi:hypothetical protein